MLKRVEPVLKIVCGLIALLVVIQISLTFLRKDPLADARIPDLPHLPGTNTPAAAKGTNAQSATTGTNAATAKATNSSATTNTLPPASTNLATGSKPTNSIGQSNSITGTKE